MNSIEIKKKLLEKGEICDHCLGRQITFKHKGIPNGEIGAALRRSKEETEINKIIENQNLKPKTKENCYVCKGLLNKVDEIYKKLIEETTQWEFNNFLIGCKVSEEIIDGEEELWTEITPEDAEPIKRQIKREIGKKLEKEIGKEPEFEKPDITFILNFKEDTIETQSKSLYVYGRYKKLKRGIPQTKWPCNKCKGEGCEKCNGTGQQYPDTVEKLVAEPLMEQTKAEEHKFHGQGREDKDALMLGNGRPFIIEAVKPRKRTLNIAEIQEKINEQSKGKIKVEKMRESDMNEVRELKSRRSDKTYEVWAETEKKVTEEDLKKAEKEITGEKIEQRTPTRVNHRRADRVRERKIHHIQTQKLNSHEFKVNVKAEAGTYIKELISGDYGRTRPSIAEVMKNKVSPTKLNVVKIHGPNNN